MESYLKITKALSDENRLRALMALRRSELCLCQLIELLGLAPSTVSKHMAMLHQAGLVERRKEGKWHFFRLAAGGASPLVAAALALTLEALHDEPRVRGDARELQAVCDRNLEEVAACYRS